MSPHPTIVTWKHWLPVITLAFAAFVFNTTEFAPIGLLADISQTFQMTEAHTGLMITGYAWFVAIVSLPLMLLTGKIERRKLLIFLFILFIASHILSAFAWSFTVLMIARIGIACAHAIFWSITAPLAVRLAPQGHRARALGFLVTGSSLATVLGLPLGRIIGQQFGWQITFLTIGVLAFLLLFILAYTLPLLPSQNAGSVKNLPSLFRRPALITIYIITAIVITGHFTAYSYIETFMQNLAGFSENFTTIILLIFGVAGILGSVVFAHYNNRYPFAALSMSILVVSLCLASMVLASYSIYTTAALCIIWGIAQTVIALCLQTKVLDAAPDATDVAMSMFSGIFNVGIGSGALMGSQVILHLGISDIGYVGTIFTTTGLLISLFFLRRMLANTKTPATHSETSITH